MSIRQTYVEQVEQDRDARLRYEEVEDALDPAEAAKVERLREEAKAKPCNSYGHDLVAAIARGWRNKASEAIREAARCYSLSANYGVKGLNERKPNIQFAGLLHLIIRYAAESGATAEDIRRILQSELDRSDSTSIEKAVERYS